MRRLTGHWCLRGTPVRSARLAGFAFAAVASLAWVGCSHEAPAAQDEPVDSPVAVTPSAMYSLAPKKVAAEPARENVLAATATETPSPAATLAAADGRAGAPPPASPGCVNGWTMPERGSPLRGAVLDMMRERPGERFVVEEIRYFVGPEDAEVISPRGDVERWYVKAYTDAEPRRRQRWLVRRAAVGSGVDALAPYDSTGYGASTWRRPDAPDERFADPFERPCQGAPPGEKCMGLPREVLGCLAGT